MHINGTGGSRTPEALRMVDGARARGLDVTMEVYPYIAGSSPIESGLFNPGWQENRGITYSDLMWVDTGERLTRETFDQYRKQGGRLIMFLNTEETLHKAIAHPLTVIASDGLLTNGKGHPRGAGTYARVLGKYVREDGALSLMDAIRKCSLMPAQRLELTVPQMRNKGRLKVGADADITVFDPVHVIDKATFEDSIRTDSSTLSWVASLSCGRGRCRPAYFQVNRFVHLSTPSKVRRVRDRSMMRSCLLKWPIRASPLTRNIGSFVFPEPLQQRRAYSIFRDAYFQLVDINPERSRHALSLGASIR
jgi:hypothetical protein